MSTLFSEIQRLLERTYASVGVNLEECLIDRRRCSQLSALAGAQAAELSMLARTFLRAADGRLRVGIYYSSLAYRTARDTRSAFRVERCQYQRAHRLRRRNQPCFACRIEVSTRRGADRDEAMPAILELQAQVDTYLVLLLFVAFFRRPGKVTRADRRWLRFHMFESRHSRSFRDKTISARYAETTYLAQSYTRYLESLAASRRVEEIRLFHALEYDRKRERILALRDRIRKP